MTTIEIDGIRFALQNDGLAIVVGYREGITVANISSRIDYNGVKYTVKSIGGYAFYQNSLKDIHFLI